MTTIKFPRPDGEARLEWRVDTDEAEGGLVCIEIDGFFSAWFGGNLEETAADLRADGISDPTPILAEAERIRNANRRLGENEWRSEAGSILTFSNPRLLGFDYHWSHWKSSKPYGANLPLMWMDTPHEPALSWHRRAYFPLLKPDECYPPGELPRKMADDEVRLPDGSAVRMDVRPDGAGRPWLNAGQFRWRPGCPAIHLDHPAHVDGQLARLQAFWERNQPKEAELRLSPAAVLTDRPWSEYPLGTKAFAAGGGHWTRVTNGWRWGNNGSTFPTPGGDAVSVAVPESIPPHVPGPGRLYGPEVTPSGEVKAPEVGVTIGPTAEIPPHAFRFVDTGGRESLIWFDWLCKSYGDGGKHSWPVSASDDLPALYQAAALALPDDKLRALYAALSDHIRRDGVETDDRASMWETTALCEKERREQAEALAEERRHAHNEIFAALQKSEARVRELESAASDLTELREAWKAWDTSQPDALETFNRLTGAVERLVGK